MFEKIAKFVVKYRALVLLFWAAVVITAAFGAVRIESVLTGSFGSVENSESQVVREAMSEFPAQSPDSIVLVMKAGANELSVGDPAFDDTMKSIVSSFEKVPQVGRIVTYLDSGVPENQLVSSDGRIALVLVGLNTENLDAAEQVVPLLRDELKTVSRPEGMQFFVTGPPAIYYDAVVVGKEDTNRAELIALPITGITLVLAFAALVAAAIPLMIGVISVSVSLAILYILGAYLGVFLNTFAQTITTMVGLAVGIDYALLMVARFREALKENISPDQAAIRATTTAGRTVAFSGFTVAVSLAALLLPDSLILRSMGYAGVITVLVAIAATLTAVPALLSLLGERVNAPRALHRLLTRPIKQARGIWQRLPRMVLRRPLITVLSVLLILTLLTIPAKDLIPDVPGVEVLPSRVDSQQGAQALEEMGKLGAVNPLQVLIDTGVPGTVFNRDFISSLYDVTKDLETIPRIESIISPTSGSVLLNKTLYRAYYSSEEAARSGPIATLADSTVSTGGQKVLLTVFPEGQITSSATGELRTAILTRLEQEPLLNGSKISFGGWAQESAESFAATWDVFPQMIVLILLATFVVLTVAFRSLLMPLKAVVLNAFSVLASFGVLVAVFQYGWGAKLFGVTELPDPMRIDFLIPVLLFAIVFGLSMDYEVFLVSRIRELHEGGLDTEKSTVEAIERTGPIITWAALLMVTVFLAFLSASTLYIKQTGLPLAVAIIVDATLVRIGLVPAFMKLAGKWNWWLPAPLKRVLPPH